jgi:hypothetical protein
MDKKIIQICECALGTIGCILILPVFIITSPILSIIYIKDREILISKIIDMEEEIKILTEIKKSL